MRVLFSGPAGGVIGAAQAAVETGFDSFCTLDMGGTSTDIAFHSTLQAKEGDARRSLEPVLVAGHPLAVPSLDIHTIGCGGGSIASVDAGGVLHVGPESAGADPGPVCYGQSDRPTVTDAHVLLGHVRPGTFLGGKLDLDLEAVERAFQKLGKQLGVSAVEAAQGVLDVARAAMRRAVGVMTLERGQDPERLALIAFGGAGGLHAASLTQSLRLQACVIPSHPGALSARGMTQAEPIRDLSQGVLLPLEQVPKKERRAIHKRLATAAIEELRAGGARAKDIVLEHTLDLRYRGQSFELSLPDGDDPEEAFHAAYEKLYGYALRERDIELVCLRTRARVPSKRTGVQRVRKKKLPKRAIREERSVIFDKPKKTKVIDRAQLEPGHSFSGPALVEEYSGTSVIPAGCEVRVSAHGHLVLRFPS